MIVKSPSLILSDEANKYLNLYVAERNWIYDLEKLQNRENKRHTNEGAKASCRKIVAATILMPYLSKVYVPINPPDLLFGCHKYHQFPDFEWFDELTKIWKLDKQISDLRLKVEDLGIIENLDFVPTTRQAFGWLRDKAVEVGDLTPDNRVRVEESFRRLVWAYGGTSIIETFNKVPLAIGRKVLNWRTGYFFERVLCDTFKPEQILIMKKEELRSNSNRVKTVKRN